MVGGPSIDFENACDASLVLKEKYRTGTSSLVTSYFYSVAI